MIKYNPLAQKKNSEVIENYDQIQLNFNLKDDATKILNHFSNEGE